MERPALKRTYAEANLGAQPPQIASAEENFSGLADTAKRANNKVSRVVFTLNNYSDDEYNAIVRYENQTWIVVAKETAPTTGTKHLQGAMILNKRCAISSIRKCIGFTRAWIKPMKGTPQQCLEYCSKEDENPFVCGDMPKPGKRNDLLLAVQALKTQRISTIVADESIATCFVKYPRGLRELE